MYRLVYIKQAYNNTVMRDVDGFLKSNNTRFTSVVSADCTVT